MSSSESSKKHILTKRDSNVINWEKEVFSSACMSLISTTLSKV